MSISRPASESRVVSVAGALNLRDLGGLRVAGGGVVRSGRIFRSEYPSYLAAPGVVRALGLGAVVDLRRGREAATECVDWAAQGVRYARHPLSAGGESSWRASYPSYLEHGPERVAGAVLEVMRSSRDGVLFHCAAGKDRTGIVAVLLLRVLGVADADIVDDYVLSGPSVEAVLTRLRGMELYAGMLDDATTAQQLPNPAMVVALLDWLDCRGGAAAWLSSNGVPPAVIEDFRRSMVEA